VTVTAASSSRGVALSALVIGIGLIGDTLIYAVDLCRAAALS
jgi:hypothetical protein